MRRLRSADSNPGEEFGGNFFESDSLFEKSLQTDGGGEDRGGLMGLIRKKRNLIDICLEDEDYGVEPC